MDIEVDRIANETTDGSRESTLDDLVRCLDDELAAADRVADRAAPEPSLSDDLMIRFSVGELVLAATVDQMSEIEAVPALTFVPRLPPVVRGLANLRGQIIVVLDLTRHLDAVQEATLESAARRIIVLDQDRLERPYGVLVDRVFGIGPFDRGRSRPHAPSLPDSLRPFLIGSIETKTDEDIPMIDLASWARSVGAADG
ncbi:MAG: chemotaxis protein CheW [Acidobacteriota bacterium]